MIVCDWPMQCLYCWPPYHGAICPSFHPHFDVVLTHWANFGLISCTVLCRTWGRLTWNTLSFISVFHRGDDNVCVHVFMHWLVCAYVFEGAVFFACLPYYWYWLCLWAKNICHPWCFIPLFVFIHQQPSTSSPPQEASVSPLAHAGCGGCPNEPRLQLALQRPQTGEGWELSSDHINIIKRKLSAKCFFFSSPQQQDYEQEFLQRRFSGGSQSYGGDSPRLSPCSSMGKLSKSDEQLSSMEQDSGQCSRNTSCETLGKATTKNRQASLESI